MSSSSNKPTIAFVAVGSNIKPEHNILLALDRLEKHVDVCATSSFYRTEPIDRPDQPKFINGVWKVQSSFGARTLKYDILKKIEEDLGRVRTEDRFAPRTIDLDLILFGDEIIDEPGLFIPDQDIYSRAFVAVPLKELVPNLRIPDTLKPISSLSSAKMVEELILLPKFSSDLKQRLTK